tara:strand:+ start:663 stop:884 length:222 start_codon:yes stop_codon:yes gene_type:complete
MTDQDRKEQLQKIIDSLKPRKARSEFEQKIIDALDDYLLNKANVRNDKDATINNKQVKEDFIDALLKLHKENK